MYVCVYIYVFIYIHQNEKMYCGFCPHPAFTLLSPRECVLSKHCCIDVNASGFFSLALCSLILNCQQVG